MLPTGQVAPRVLSRVSWDLLQLVTQDPPMLPFVGFHPIPIRSRDNDENFGASRQGSQGGCRMERRRLEWRSRRLHQSLDLTPEILNSLLQSLRRGLCVL